MYSNSILVIYVLQPHFLGDGGVRVDEKEEKAKTSSRLFLSQ